MDITNKIMTLEQAQKLNEVYEFMENMGSTSQIPLVVDQALRHRLRQKNNVVLHCGQHTTTGGSATETIPKLAGVASTDVIVVTLHTAGGIARTISSATCGTDSASVIFNADPSTDHIVNYIVVRP